MRKGSLDIPIVCTGIDPVNSASSPASIARAATHWCEPLGVHANSEGTGAALRAGPHSRDSRFSREPEQFKYCEQNNRNAANRPRSGAAALRGNGWTVG